jgi:hypothetical protein
MVLPLEVLPLARRASICCTGLRSKRALRPRALRQPLVLAAFGSGSPNVRGTSSLAPIARSRDAALCPLAKTVNEIIARSRHTPAVGM